MADPAAQAFQAGSEILTGAPIPFRFEVTWNSLTPGLAPAPLDAIVPLRPRPVLSAEAREWEMVLPRMRRPAALAPPAPAPPQRAIEAPRFLMPPEPAIPRRWIGLIAAALVLTAGAAAYRFTGQNNSQSQNLTVISGIEMGSAGWITEWAAGSARGRQLFLYLPSLPSL